MHIQDTTKEYYIGLDLEAIKRLRYASEHMEGPTREAPRNSN